MLCIGILAYWAFGCGLALTIPAHNRMVAIFCGLMTVVISIMPGFAAVKGLRGHLGINPAWIQWPPLALLFALGLWMMWRRR